MSSRCFEAADAGVPLAEGLVAYQLLSSRSDVEKGKRMARAAAAAGDRRSIRLLGDINYFGMGQAVAKAAALPFYRTAVEKGEPHAMAMLGYVYALGDQMCENACQ